MKRDYFYALLKRKVASLALIVLAACAIAAAMIMVYKALIWLLPQATAEAWQDLLERLAENPEQIRALLRQKGAEAPWFFVGGQVLQVILAPIPGQAVALAGGFVFGFWKGWALTTIGLTIGSLIAMGLSRWLGVKFVRRFVSPGLMERFDMLTTNGGYNTFFMIFLLPVMPDDAVCFLAGLTKLKMLPLTLVCLLGRAPGMAVLSLVGAGFTTGLSLSVKCLFAVMMIISVPLWLFWELLEEKINEYCLKRRNRP